MFKLPHIPGLAAAALLCAIPAAGSELENHFASGVLSAGRNQTLVCTGVHGLGSVSLKVSLKSPSTGELIHAGATKDCPDSEGTVPCSISHQHDSAIPLPAYCHMEAEETVAAGNLRLNIPTGPSQASTNLQPVTPSSCDPGPRDEHFQSGLLTAGRNDTLVCTVINKSTENANVFVRLSSYPFETTSFTLCDMAPGKSCEASFEHTSPVAKDFSCYVLVTVENGTVTGNLRLDSPTNVTKASSDLAFLREICHDDQQFPGSGD